MRTKRNFLLKSWKFVFLCFTALLFNLASFGQVSYCAGDPVPSTQPSLRDNPAYKPGECPANDIQIVSARIVKTNDLCNTCTPGTIITADLYIRYTITQIVMAGISVFLLI